MARPLRIIFCGAWYHVMHRGASHQQIFFKEDHGRLFLKILEEITNIYGIEIHAFCLMSNHYHLIVHTPRGNLSDAMRHLNSKYTQIINLDMKRDGALFRGRYKSILISEEKYLVRLSRYIHRNPLEANITNDLKKYKWSSFKYFVDLRYKLSWLSTSEILNRYQKTYNFSYENYVKNPRDEDTENVLAKPNASPVLGDDEYREFIFKQLQEKSLSAEIVGADRIIVPPTIDTILKMVAVYFNINVEDLKYCKKRIKNDPRRIAIYLCREMGGYNLCEIGKAMGNVSYKTVSNTIYLAKNDDDLSRHVQDIKAKLLNRAKKLGEG